MRKLEYIEERQNGYTTNVYEGDDLRGRVRCEFAIVSEHYLIIMRQMGWPEVMKWFPEYSLPEYKAILEPNTTEDEAKKYCKEILEELVEPITYPLKEKHKKYANGC